MARKRRAKGTGKRKKKGGLLGALASKVSGVAGGARSAVAMATDVDGRPVAIRRKRRGKAMYMKGGRLMMGFTQKEVKAAMRKTYGGKKK